MQSYIDMNRQMIESNSIFCTYFIISVDENFLIYLMTTWISFSVNYQYKNAYIHFSIFFFALIYYEH